MEDLDGRTGFPYLVSVQDFDIARLRKIKIAVNRRQYSQKSLIAKIKAVKPSFNQKEIISAKIKERNSSRDVKALEFKGKTDSVTLQGDDLLKFHESIGLYNSAYRSKRDYYDLGVSGKDYVFIVYGFGWHRMGMSQQGAIFLSQAGRTWEQILHYYYKGITINNF
jgi:stage II sporulation protein D